MRCTTTALILVCALAPTCVSDPAEGPRPQPQEAPGSPGQGQTAPRTWTRTFMAPAVLVAREVSIEGPAGLLDHVALAVDKQVHDYSVRTVPEGLLQELRVKPGMTDALVLCHLDRLEIAAETCIRVLERPGDVAVSVTATGNAVWRTPDGAERSGEVLKLTGREPE